jgi:hypothetical protein
MASHAAAAKMTTSHLGAQHVQAVNSLQFSLQRSATENSSMYAQSSIIIVEHSILCSDMYSCTVLVSQSVSQRECQWSDQDARSICGRAVNAIMGLRFAVCGLRFAVCGFCVCGICGLHGLGRFCGLVRLP